MTLCIFVCRVCGKTNPCTLIVPVDTSSPSKCPFDVKTPKWTVLKDPFEDDFDCMFISITRRDTCLEEVDARWVKKIC